MVRAETWVDSYRFRDDVLDLRGDCPGAQKRYEKAVKLAPSLPADCYSWGVALAARGMSSLAVVEELFGPVAPLTTAIHARGEVLARERGLSVYDALMVAAAQDAGCQLLFSEDLQHGQKFGTLTVENPFRSEAD